MHTISLVSKHYKLHVLVGNKLFTIILGVINPVLPPWRVKLAKLKRDKFMLFSGDIKGKLSVKPQITVLPVPLPCIP
jgi:hypothetical protein